MQLDEAERGFSFRLDGPLDMRMGARRAERRRCGGARLRARSRRHHRDARRGAPCPRRRPRHRARARRGADRAPRGALADIVARVVHARPGAIHPATRTFQALRIFVNEELDELAAALAAAERVLQARRPAGRGRVPFARRPHRQDVPRRARPAQRGGSRHCRKSVQAPPTFRAADQAAGRRRTRPRSPPIRARARPSCAPAERTDAPPRDARRRAAAAAAAVARRRREGRRR